ncbi:MAG: DNA replication/repair protein RecF [Gammaproteobacteria bacterium]|nr:DNA replication/repair protein RecF [Gammaproteobacteria bacterium]
MSLQSLFIKNYRNLTEIEVDLGAKVNFLFGANGSGKTSFLDACYFLSSARSFRASERHSCIKEGEGECLVRGNVRKDSILLNIGVSKDRQGLTRIKINERNVDRTSDLAKELPTVFLGPESMGLLIGPPAQRRSFMNWGAFHVEPRFRDIWREANRCLRQRNQALQFNKRDSTQIEVWSEELVKISERIDQVRRDYFQQFSPRFEEVLGRISNLENVEIQYFSGWAEDKGLKESMKINSEMDLRRGYTGSGFHRADLKVLVNHKPADKFCSRGELKALVWSMKLAQGTLLSDLNEQDKENESLIFLIDDLASEFDDYHRRKVQEYLYQTNHQAIVTGIDEWSLFGGGDICDGRVFHVKHGKLKCNMEK